MMHHGYGHIVLLDVVVFLWFIKMFQNCPLITVLVVSSGTFTDGTVRMTVLCCDARVH